MGATIGPYGPSRNRDPASDNDDQRIAVPHAANVSAQY
jgi:hypothetical protein